MELQYLNGTGRATRADTLGDTKVDIELTHTAKYALIASGAIAVVGLIWFLTSKS